MVSLQSRDVRYSRVRKLARNGLDTVTEFEYLRQLDSADRQEPSEAIIIKTTRIKEKMARLKQEMTHLRH